MNLKLKVDTRTVVGKKVKQLRRKGILPANVFGKGITSKSIQVEEKAFRVVARSAGTTKVLYLSLGKEELPVLIQNAQYDSITDHLLHIDFRHVDLKEKVEAEVPVEIVGEHPLVKSHEADALLLVDSVMVEALPTQIPEKFAIDISQLKKIGDQVTIGDLPASKDYSFVDEKDRVIVQLT